MTEREARDHCPLPPADFAKRELPVRSVEAMRLMRIHPRGRDPLFYSRRSACTPANRFDAPADEFGVLYASLSFAACMAETLVRDRFAGSVAPLVLEESRLKLRCLSLLEPAGPGLRLADFTAPLFGLGFSTQVLATPDYLAPNLWSRAVHDHPARVDGIYFVSRYANEASVAVFDRARLAACGAPVPLLECPELGPFLARHDIALVP
ncbi:RES family NAD+ phosphorylase [Pseudoduganella sp. GCM10020061]|uniref:RES family NAD+ phosphorylase n=1 Tax=Pseudoduganella sp. GCM10020061 TaxID=3317345 RepID=UPI00362901AF